MNRRTLINIAAGAALVLAATASTHTTPSASRDDDMDWVNRLVFTRYATGYTSKYKPVDQSVAVATMIAHHQDAIDGSNEYLRHGTDPTIRAFAQRVLRVQTEQIEQMNTWLDHNGGRNVAAAWMPVFCTIENWGTETGYLTTMVAHHQAAIDMYHGYALNGSITDPEMGLLMRAIGKGQTGEIAWMEQQSGPADPTPAG